MQQQAITLKDYREALIRRRGSLAAVMALVLFITVALAFGLPSIYRSTATILVEQQDIPDNLIASTVTGYADERIQLIAKRVMTQANLHKIIKKLNLHTPASGLEELEAITVRLREHTLLEMVSAEETNPRSGKQREITIAFTVSYEDKSPERAQQVAKELASLYLEENRASRIQLATETVAFLDQQARKVRARIAELESQLAKFKEQHLGALPEQRDLNLQLIERTEREISTIQNQMRTLEERRIYLESELAQVSPTNPIYSPQGDRILTAEGRLKGLQAQYTSLSAVYSADHPDLVRMRREITALEGQLGVGGDTTALTQQVSGLRQQLAAVKDRYSSEHPDVKRLERALSKAEEELNKAMSASNGRPIPAAKPDNPAYIQLRTNLEATQSELQALRLSEREQKAKLAVLEGRLTKAPWVESDYRALTRDYEDALNRYKEITAKQTTAELAKSLESEQKGDRFSLLESPVVPDAPISPNRLAILFLGTVLSFAGGIGTVAVMEVLDDSVHGRKALIEFFGVPPLAVIPNIQTEADLRRRRWRRVAIAGACIFGLALLTTWIHTRLAPLHTILELPESVETDAGKES